MCWRRPRNSRASDSESRGIIIHGTMRLTDSDLMAKAIRERRSSYSRTSISVKRRSLCLSDISGLKYIRERLYRHKSCRFCVALHLTRTLFRRGQQWLDLFARCFRSRGIYFFIVVRANIIIVLAREEARCDVRIPDEICTLRRARARPQFGANFLSEYINYLLEIKNRKMRERPNRKLKNAFAF